MFLPYKTVFRECTILQEISQILYVKIKKLKYPSHKFIIKVKTNITLELIDVGCSYVTAHYNQIIIM
jgi:hypothetical protein